MIVTTIINDNNDNIIKYLIMAGITNGEKDNKCPSLGPEQRLEIKTVLNSPRWGLYITLLNMKPKSPAFSQYIYIYN